MAFRVGCVLPGDFNSDPFTDWAKFVFGKPGAPVAVRRLMRGLRSNNVHMHEDSLFQHHLPRLGVIADNSAVLV